MQSPTASLACEEMQRLGLSRCFNSYLALSYPMGKRENQEKDTRMKRRRRLSTSRLFFTGQGWRRWCWQGQEGEESPCASIRVWLQGNETANSKCPIAVSSEESKWGRPPPMCALVILLAVCVCVCVCEVDALLATYPDIYFSWIERAKWEFLEGEVEHFSFRFYRRGKQRKDWYTDFHSKNKDTTGTR